MKMPAVVVLEAAERAIAPAMAPSTANTPNAAGHPPTRCATAGVATSPTTVS